MGFWSKSKGEGTREGNFAHADAEKIDYGKFFYLMNYRSHYSQLGDGTFLQGLEDEEKCLSELFLLRGWVTQFGFRIFNSYNQLADSIVYQVVNQSKYLGVGVFTKTHGFSPEDALGDDFMSLVERRWSSYDKDVEQVSGAKIPALEISSKALRFGGTIDPVKTYMLSLDVLDLLGQIKQEAFRIRLLRDK